MRLSRSRLRNSRDLPRYLWERTAARSLVAPRAFKLEDESLGRIAAWTRSWTAPALSICIPTKDRLDLLVPCLTSLAETCGGRPVDVVLGNTGSSAETLAICSSLGLRIVSLPEPFNFSRACNEMACASAGATLLFLNSDTAAISSSWVERALDSSDHEVTGAALVYPGTSRLQHAGVMAVRARSWLQRNAYRPPRANRGASRLAIENVGIGKPLASVTTMSSRVMAVTGAFLLTTRSQFQALKGFDEAFRVDLQDIDYCLRAWARGIEVVCRRDIVFSHQHAGSRGRYEFPLQDWQLLLDRWTPELERWSAVRASL